MIVRHRTPFSTAFGPAAVDRAFDQLTSSLFEPRRRMPTVDAEWRESELVLTVDLPGVSADAVSVEVAGRNLTISAHTDALDWSRELQLGTSLDPNKVSARHLDGRLTVTIGTVDAPEARAIAIDTSPAPAPAIDAGSETAEGTAAEQDQPSVTASSTE